MVSTALLSPTLSRGLVPKTQECALPDYCWRMIQIFKISDLGGRLEGRGGWILSKSSLLVSLMLPTPAIKIYDFSRGFGLGLRATDRSGKS